MGIGEQFEFEKTGRIDREPRLSTGMDVDRTIRHRDGTIVSQGSFNALMAENDRLSKVAKAAGVLVKASRNAASQCYGFRDGTLAVDFEVITELRNALADWAVAVEA